MAFLVVGVLTMTFGIMVKSAEASELGNDLFDDCKATLNPIDLFNCVGDFFGVVFDVLTVNIDGAPWWVRLPLGIVFSLPWILLIITIVLELVPG